MTTIWNLTIQNSSSAGLQLSTGTHTVEDCEFRDNGFLQGDGEAWSATVG